jgi:hypothetical protein
MQPIIARVSWQTNWARTYKDEIREPVNISNRNTFRSLHNRFDAALYIAAGTRRFL